MDDKGLAGITSAKLKGGWGGAFLLLALGLPILLPSPPALGQAAGAASPSGRRVGTGD